MLRKETVTPETLELLKRLMQVKLLTSFVLVGGTALALQIAHRRSIDIFSKGSWLYFYFRCEKRYNTIPKYRCN